MKHKFMLLLMAIGLLIDIAVPLILMFMSIIAFARGRMDVMLFSMGWLIIFRLGDIYRRVKGE